MQPIDGKALALQTQNQLKETIQTTNLHPKLAVLLVGDDPASHLYVNLKEKACTTIGIATDIRRLSETTTDAELITLIQQWNADSSVHGILVQLPLPPAHDADTVIAAVAPSKDADGFHPANVTKLLNGEAAIIPPLLEGILRLIGATDVVPNRTPTVIIANSDTFAVPLSHLLKTAGAFVQTMTPDTIDPDIVQKAKIIVIAVGRPGFLTRDMISSGACVIDVGTNKIADKLVVGDVDTEHIMDIPGWISPVPGGVGPMTIAMLLKNVVELSSMAALASQH